MKASSTGHRPRTCGSRVHYTRVRARREATRRWYGCAILLYGRLHKRPGLHIAFMMQRRPALAGNNGSTSTSPPLTTFPLSSLLPQPLQRPRGSYTSFFSFGNRLVKVITLITHRTNTPSHLFEWTPRRSVSPSFLPFPLAFGSFIIPYRGRVAPSRKFLLLASGAK